MQTIDKYLGLNFFIVLNVLLIVLSQTVGGGILFFSTGLIHIIALGFVALALLRVFFHYYTYDPILEKFIHASLVAMGIFAISHIVEFFSFEVLHRNAGAIYINVANLYLISLLVIAIGTESFLRVLYDHSARTTRILSTGVVFLVLMTIALIFNDKLISLDTNSYAPITYTIAILAAIGFNLYKMYQIKEGVKFMPTFVNYLTVSIVFIGIAALTNIYYEFFIAKFALPEYQALYLSHYAFYIALSLYFIAFGKISHLGGMLEQVKNMHSISPETT